MPGHDTNGSGYDRRVMTGKQAHPKHAVTPPKGRPTRGRGAAMGDPRVLTSTFQWATAIGAILVAFVVLVIVTS
jgi:hypothetical protein